MTDATGVSERIRRVRNDLAPAERRVVEAMLADYPMARCPASTRAAGTCTRA